MPWTLASRAINPAEAIHASRWIRAAILALGIAVLIGTYWNAFENPLLSDDYHTILRNPRLLRTATLWEAFWRPDYLSGNPIVRGHYRPLVVSSLALNCLIGSECSRRLLRGTNLLLHVAVGLVLFRLSFLVLRDLLHRPPPVAYWASFIGCAFWLFAPAHTEVIDLVSARSDLMVALCLGLAACTLVQVASAPAPVSRLKCMQAAALGALCTALGFGAKELAVVGPALLLVLFLGLRNMNPRGAGGAALWVVAGSALVVFIALVARIVMFGALLPINIQDIGVAKAVGAVVLRALLQARVVLEYLRILLTGTGMTMSWDPYADRDKWEWHAVDVMFALALALLVALAWMLRRRQPHWTLFLLWFLVAQLPTSLLPRLVVAFDHRIYLASAMLVPALALTAEQVWSRSSMRPLGGVLAIAVLAFFGHQIVTRNADWSSGMRLWEHAVAASPDSDINRSIAAWHALLDGRCDAAYRGLASTHLQPWLPIGNASVAIGSPDEKLIGWAYLGMAAEISEESTAAAKYYRRALDLADPKSDLATYLAMRLARLSPNER